MPTALAFPAESDDAKIARLQPMDAVAAAALIYLHRLVTKIVAQRAAVPTRRALLVGISGIDAAGKGYCAAQVARFLAELKLNVALIGTDGWLNLPHVRFHPDHAAEHFYEHAFRFDEMFDTLIEPLRQNRSVDLRMDYVEETATTYRRHRYRYRDIDVVLLEGIFLLKRSHRHHLDLSCWIESSFETALARAIGRGQEGLSPPETIRVFETIYFPAQRIHFVRDAPQSAADLILPNEATGVDERAGREIS